MVGAKLEKGTALPGQDRPIRGRLGRGRDWEEHWYGRLRSNNSQPFWDDSNQRVRVSFPMLSLYDRLTPTKNTLTANETIERDRFELLRRGLRFLDLSHVLAAGQMVVIGEAEGPLPFPLEVNGDRMSGQGVTFYQFVVPLDRSALDAPPTTQEVEAAEVPSNKDEEVRMKDEG